MAILAPPAINALPTPPDPNDRATFNPRAYPWSLAQQQLAQDVGAIAANMYNNALEAQAKAIEAGDRRDEASAYATAASLAANATKWVSGTSYADGALVWSPDSWQTYRRKGAGGGTTDPVNDAVNWEPFARDAVGAIVSLSGSATAQRFQTYVLGTQAITLTLPAVAYGGDWIGIVPPLSVTANTQQVANAGHLLLGELAAMVIDVRQPLRLVYVSAGTGWIIST